MTEVNFESCILKDNYLNKNLLLDRREEKKTYFPRVVIFFKALISDLSRLSQSIVNSVRFRWPDVTGESLQFIHTVTAETLTLQLGNM